MSDVPGRRRTVDCVWLDPGRVHAYAAVNGVPVEEAYLLLLGAELARRSARYRVAGPHVVDLATGRTYTVAEYLAQCGD